MAKLKRRDLEELIKWFEDTLTQLTKIDRRQKMKMRKKIRDEIHYLSVWPNPTPEIMITRLEERLRDVFRAMPFGMKEDLIKVLIKMTTKSK